METFLSIHVFLISRDIISRLLTTETVTLAFVHSAIYSPHTDGMPVHTMGKADTAPVSSVAGMCPFHTAWILP